VRLTRRTFRPAITQQNPSQQPALGQRTTNQQASQELRKQHAVVSGRLEEAWGAWRIISMVSEPMGR
jgi:hypothetical protein